MEDYLKKILTTPEQKNKNVNSDKIKNTIKFSNKFNKYLTKDEELLNDEEYQKIIYIINSLFDNGIIHRTAGHCLSGSDMIQKMLSAHGIDSELVECDLTVYNKIKPSLNLIGHNNNVNPSATTIDTHVVCVTKTKIPILIDISIAHYENCTERPFFCERVSSENNMKLVDVEIDGVHWSYVQKAIPKILSLHHQSIVDRFNTDKIIFSKISNINKVIVILAVICTINFIRGIYDFGQKYIIKDNGFGPNPELVDKIDK